MIIRLVIAVLFTGAASVFFLNKGEQSNPEKEALIQQAVYMAMSQAHLKPVAVDDQFSASVYDEFIKSIDGRKRFLTQEDLSQFEQYRDQIDDLLKEQDLTFFNLITEVVDAKIKGSEQLYQEILAEPFDFNEDDQVETDFEKLGFASNETERKARWEKRLKFYTLQELESRLSAQEDMDQDSIKSFAELEVEAREDVREAYERWYENFEKVRRSDRFEQYINAITRQYDPHSQYFSPKGKQDFNMRMGGKLEGIGAQLQTDGELTKVVTIVPGGPVWKDEQIEVNDHILKVQQEGEDPVDITGMRIDDVVSQIRGPKGSFVTLTIKKKDGSQIEVQLERDVINLEIARARAAILKDEVSGDQIGYIDLPMFYNSFDGPEGNSCTKDVANQIELMKDKGIKGLILDLRDNLGGALIDAIDISGLFIEEGPVVQVKSRDRRPYVHSDENAQVAYNGPLIVLVNNFSASASEIVAGALKDYGRAIIVGSQTFGKGSVQNFIDLDRAIMGNSSLKPLGEIKLTIQKYYRVNGASTQLKGVMPDIVLPDSYDLLPTGEREHDGALDWSMVKSLSFDQNVYHASEIEALQQKSAERIKASEAFKLIQDQAEWLRDNKDNTTYSLNLDKYRARLEALDQRGENFEDVLMKPVESMSVEVIPMDFESEITQEEKEARTEAWLESVEQDFYLEESIAIVRDILKIKA